MMIHQEHVQGIPDPISNGNGNGHHNGNGVGPDLADIDAMLDAEHDKYARQVLAESADVDATLDASVSNGNGVHAADLGSVEEGTERQAQPPDDRPEVQEAPEQGQGTVETLEDQPVGNQQDETDLDQGDGEKPWSALDIEHDGEWYPPGGDWDTYLGWDTASNCWLPQDPDPAPRRRSKRTQTEH